MKAVFSSAAVLMLFAALSVAQQATPKCNGSAVRIVGKCFTFRGRLGLYNGGHTIWIWRADTKHRYWVEGDLPEVPGESLDWDHFYWGDFEACPTTQFKKGYAQGICLKGVEKLTKTKRTNG